MGLRIATNIASLSAQRSLSKNAVKQTNIMSKLSSGSRINKASDDAAGLAMSEKLRARITGTRQAERNANDGISMLQTADSWLQKVNDMLARMSELSIEAGDGTKTQGGRVRGLFVPDNAK